MLANQNALPTRSQFRQRNQLTGRVSGEGLPLKPIERIVGEILHSVHRRLRTILLAQSADRPTFFRLFNYFNGFRLLVDWLRDEGAPAQLGRDDKQPPVRPTIQRCRDARVIRKVARINHARRSSTTYRLEMKTRPPNGTRRGAQRQWATRVNATT